MYNVVRWRVLGVCDHGDSSKSNHRFPGLEMAEDARRFASEVADMMLGVATVHGIEDAYHLDELCGDGARRLTRMHETPGMHFNDA